MFVDLVRLAPAALTFHLVGQNAELIVAHVPRIAARLLEVLKRRRHAASTNSTAGRLLQVLDAASADASDQFLWARSARHCSAGRLPERVVVAVHQCAAAVGHPQQSG